MRSIITILLIALVLPFGSANGSEQYRIDSGEPSLGHLFATSVAMDGNNVIVGTRGDNNFAGAAYFFVRDGEEWTRTQKVSAEDAERAAWFGVSVDIDGNYAIIGAKNDGDENDYGAAYIFEHEGDEWIQQQKVTADDAGVNDYFGTWVAIDGEYAIVGSPQDDLGEEDEAGSAYIFHFNGDEWVQQQKLIADDFAGGDQFGNAVSISGDYVIVGSKNCDSDVGILTGAAYIFNRDGDEWTQTHKLEADDKAAADYFGVSVAISGDWAIVGAWSDDLDGGNAAGAAYLFEHNGDDWNQQKIVANDAEAGDNFGINVSIDGNQAIVGAKGGNGDFEGSGCAYLFALHDGEWIQQEKLAPDDGAFGNNFGITTSISGDYVVAGAPNFRLENRMNAGAAYIYSDLATEVSDNQADTSSGFALSGIYPNPFNATITISYALPQSQRVGLHLYDMSGRLVESFYEGYRTAGLYKARWNAESTSAGIYFVRMEADGFSDTRKIVLVK